jgi:hypothetical protein
VSSKKRDPEEVVNSLTGWDEIAIEQASGKTLEQMQEKHQILMVRCLAAILEWREKLEAGDAAAKYATVYREVMDRPQHQVTEMFDMDQAEDVMPDEPDSETGKDDSEPGPAPMTSPSSASSPESSPISTPA